MEYLALGSRIRQLREKKGLSSIELARSIDLPVEKLERIERNEEQPIIATLIRLSKALDVNVADILRDRPRKRTFDLMRASDRRRVKPYLEPARGRIFDYIYEPLSEASEDKHLEAYMIEVPAYQSRRPQDDVTHPGEEFMYVLEGHIRGEIGDEVIDLAPGDSLYFRSTSKHLFYNPGQKTARALVVIYPF